MLYSFLTINNHDWFGHAERVCTRCPAAGSCIVVGVLSSAAGARGAAAAGGGSNGSAS